MQIYLSLFLLTLAAIALGLLLASLPYLGQKINGRPHPLWALSLALFALSLACFAWLVPRLTLVGLAQYRVTTLANTMLFAAAVLQAAFFSSLNARKPRLLRYIAVIGGFAALFEWVRVTLDFDSRVILAAGASAAALVWQLLEIRRLRARESNYQLGFLYWTTVVELVCSISRVIGALTNQTKVMAFDQIPQLLVVFTVLNCLFMLLSYVGISKYWAEKISYDKARAELESAEIRTLVTEKDRLILQLMAANKTAATGALSASLAHELAQPLTSLGLNLKALKRGLQSVHASAAQQHLVDQCVESTHRLNGVLNSLRSMFIEDRDTSQAVSLHEVLATVRDLISREANKAGIRINVETSGSLVIRGRQSELQHALLNLSINALEALADEPSYDKVITLTAAGGAEGITVTVSDNGPGVSDSMSDRLFELLDSGKPHGMGLGLWLCRYIVERHGGSVAYRPNLPRGATFEIRLPEKLPSHA